MLSLVNACQLTGTLSGNILLSTALEHMQYSISTVKYARLVNHSEARIARCCSADMMGALMGVVHQWLKQICGQSLYVLGIM